ncbi:hypothetical protein PR048_019125 [Dryococelus australis]|uniref:Uncharacterized protein n=1 Tax=Dryococelus australis TaxID=614101 RepID=A0ABQ9H2Q8_9NEOP|nr:hypothetical protein PR048_019125 [Dryococelus australis]
MVSYNTDTDGNRRYCSSFVLRAAKLHYSAQSPSSVCNIDLTGCAQLTSVSRQVNCSSANASRENGMIWILDTSVANMWAIATKLAWRNYQPSTRKLAPSTFLKAVHVKVSTHEINLRKKSLLLPAYILTGVLNDISPEKLATTEGKRGQAFDDFPREGANVDPNVIHISGAQWFGRPSDLPTRRHTSTFHLRQTVTRNEYYLQKRIKTSVRVGLTRVGTPLPMSRSEGAIRATITCITSASSLLRARRAVFSPLHSYLEIFPAPEARNQRNDKVDTAKRTELLIDFMRKALSLRAVFYLSRCFETFYSKPRSHDFIGRKYMDLINIFQDTILRFILGLRSLEKMEWKLHVFHFKKLRFKKRDNSDFVLTEKCSSLTVKGSEGKLALPGKKATATRDKREGREYRRSFGAKCLLSGKFLLPANCVFCSFITYPAPLALAGAPVADRSIRKRVSRQDGAAYRFWCIGSPALVAELLQPVNALSVWQFVEKIGDITRGSGGAVARALASHHGAPASIPGGLTPGFSHVGFVLDGAACRRVFSGNSRFPLPCIPAARVSFNVVSGHEGHLRAHVLLQAMSVGGFQCSRLRDVRCLRMVVVLGRWSSHRNPAACSREREEGDGAGGVGGRGESVAHAVLPRDGSAPEIRGTWKMQLPLLTLLHFGLQPRRPHTRRNHARKARSYSPFTATCCFSEALLQATILQFYTFLRETSGVRGSMTTEAYCKILDNEMLLTLWRFYEMDPCYFQDDNSRCSVSGAIMQWYANNNVRILDWPAQSPDLKPTEHIWDELDRRVRARQAQPNSIAQLMERLQEEWRRIPVDVLQTLVENMPDRVAAVISARVCGNESVRKAAGAEQISHIPYRRRIFFGRGAGQGRAGGGGIVTPAAPHYRLSASMRGWLPPPSPSRPEQASADEAQRNPLQDGGLCYSSRIYNSPSRPSVTRPSVILSSVSQPSDIQPNFVRGCTGAECEQSYTECEPYLSASPDGLVDNDGLVEIKRIPKIGDKSLLEAAVVRRWLVRERDAGRRGFWVGPFKWTAIKYLAEISIREISSIGLRIDLGLSPIDVEDIDLLGARRHAHGGNVTEMPRFSMTVRNAHYADLETLQASTKRDCDVARRGLTSLEGKRLAKVLAPGLAFARNGVDGIAVFNNPISKQLLLRHSVHYSTNAYKVKVACENRQSPASAMSTGRRGFGGSSKVQRNEDDIM